MSTPAQYEFSVDQNKIIDELASNMRIVAFVMLVVGVLYGIAFAGAVLHAFTVPATIGQAILLGLAMLLYLAMGRWTDRAAAAFRQVVATTGQDVSLLMTALDNLRKLYVLIGTIIKIYIALIVIGLLAMIIGLALGGFRWT